MTTMQQLLLMACLLFTSCLVSKGYVLNEENGKKDQIPQSRAAKTYRSEADILTFPPRIGRSAVFDLLPFSYIMAEDLMFKLYEDMDGSKRSTFTFTPRIGRKKRSISRKDDDWKLHYDDIQRILRPIIPIFHSNLDDGYNKAKRAVFIPRIGRAPFIPVIERANTGDLSSLLM
ncbi:uncharacterized protein LOC143244756 [Tachypleus tridentatus]|uniref:uncharacterized protein LOC143244756 n=1 Tax=Tachypleus tridentatus TaxID=6853 RepID=UPI003FCFF11C